VEKPEEGEIARQKKLLEDKKRAISYLKARAEDLDHQFAVNYAKGNYTLASHDAKRLAAIMEVLGDIDVAS
jgi:muramoyltetrapeptide carboxypeptidase LdcA involved in peptidoglycan recycling